MKKSTVRYIGMFLFFTGFVALHFLFFSSQHAITADVIESSISKPAHQEALLSVLKSEKEGGLFSTISDAKALVLEAQALQNEKFKAFKESEAGVPEGISEWDFKLGGGELDAYPLALAKGSTLESYSDLLKSIGWIPFVLCILGALMWISVRFNKQPGIQNDGIFLDPLNRGVNAITRNIFLFVTIIGILLFGYFTKSTTWAVNTLVIALLIVTAVFYWEKKKNATGAKSIAPEVNAHLGVALGIYLITFYVLLYWFPAYLSNAIQLLDPLSLSLSGNPASQWFLYGFIYTISMIVMGIRMYSKYRHDKYQMARTTSVVFFQTSFAFLIPEIMVRLNQPYHDFKNIWPLDYDFLFEWNINALMSSGTFGIFILVWGIALAIVGVPLFTYFFGKRWYCSWVCGCGGLAETVGDPFRQLSDNSLRAWKFERYIIHGVFVAAIVMTALVLYTFFTGNYQLLGLDSYQLRTWYGFFIGAGFSGVVGTGFYPVMGNRAWCRFGCPLAGYLGLVQRYMSKYRITTNGSQCISCGNCSTYCEMGIDVRWYAQRGQDILRSSCVGCGICSAVCPRGVLRLENSHADIKDRATTERALHIDKDGVTLGQ